MPRNSRIQMAGKLEIRDIETLADEARELERELHRAWRQGQTEHARQPTPDQSEQRATSDEMTYLPFALGALKSARACDEFQAKRLNVRFIFGLLPTEGMGGYPYNYPKTSGISSL